MMILGPNLGYMLGDRVPYAHRIEFIWSIPDISGLSQVFQFTTLDNILLQYINVYKNSRLFKIIPCNEILIILASIPFHD